MNISRMLVAFGLGMAVAGSSCSAKDKDHARQTVQDLEDKTKKAAEDAADKTREVVSSTGEAITDGWITTKIKAKFADDKLLKDSHIDIDTTDRVVTLKGTVASSETKKRAGMIANGTEGVARVVDEVTVKAK